MNTIAGEQPRSAVPWWVLLRDRDFALYWAGQSISQVGSRVSVVALPLVAILELGASTAQVGLLQAAAFLPYLLFSLPAGLLADRMRRRPLMIVADVARAAVLLVVPAGIAFGRLSMPVLIALMFVSGAFTVLFDVCYLSALPWLVGRDRLLPANAALETSRSVAQVAGPGLAGVLVAVLRASGAVVADVVSYLCSAVALLAIRRPEPVVQRDGRAGGGLTAGWLQVRRSPLLGPQAAHLFLGNLVYGGYQAIIVVFMVRELGMSGPAVGIAVATANIGVVTGALTSPSLGRRLGLGRLVVVATLLDAGGLFVLSGIPLSASQAVTVVLLICGQGLTGFAVALFNLQSVTLRQTITPQAVLARVNAVVRLLSFGAIPLGAAAAGWIADGPGLRMTLFGLATVKLASTLIPLRTALGAVRTPPAVEPQWT